MFETAGSAEGVTPYVVSGSSSSNQQDGDIPGLIYYTSTI